MAADMFALGVEPFIAAMKSLLGDSPLNGIVRACADDLAAALSIFSLIYPLHDLFELWLHVSAMPLNVKKTIIVLTSTLLNNQILSECKAKLFLHAGSWFSCRIEEQAEYIGVIMGPRADSIFVAINPAHNGSMFLMLSSHLACLIISLIWLIIV